MGLEVANMGRILFLAFVALIGPAAPVSAEPYNVGPIMLGMNRAEVNALKPPKVMGQSPVLQCGDDKVQRSLPNPGALTLPKESEGAGMVRCVWLINLDKNWQYFGMSVGGVDVELWLMFIPEAKTKTQKLMQITLWFRADRIEQIRKTFIDSFGLPVEQTVDSTVWRNKESEAMVVPDGSGEGYYAFLNHRALLKELQARLPAETSASPAAAAKGKR